MLVDIAAYARVAVDIVVVLVAAVVLLIAAVGGVCGWQ